jgi:predicted ABC-type ATPase
MVVVAGPSGSGKSTHFPVAELGLAYFNVDDRCAELNGGAYQAIPPRFRQLAQEECKNFIERCTMDGRSFAVETTLRTDVAIRQGEAAREAGFRLEMIFVATDAVDENVSRVARRGLDGGHCAPESQIHEIYNLSLSNLPRAIDVFDEVLIFDSTVFDAAPRLVACYESGVAIIRSPPWPAWYLVALAQRA